MIRVIKTYSNIIRVVKYRYELVRTGIRISGYATAETTTVLQYNNTGMRIVLNLKLLTVSTILSTIILKSERETYKDGD